MGGEVAGGSVGGGDGGGATVGGSGALCVGERVPGGSQGPLPIWMSAQLPQISGVYKESQRHESRQCSHVKSSGSTSVSLIVLFQVESMSIQACPEGESSTWSRKHCSSAAVALSPMYGQMRKEYRP